MITIESAMVDRVDSVGFITIRTPVITAWASAKGAGILHGTQLDFPLGTSQEEIHTAVLSKYEERVRVFNKLDAQWKKKHG